MLSNVFLENLDISLVNIKSNLFNLESLIIFKNDSLFNTLVPVIPSSIYFPLYSQLIFLLIYSSKNVTCELSECNCSSLSVDTLA